MDLLRTILLVAVTTAIVNISDGATLSRESNTFWRKYFCTTWSNVPSRRDSSSFSTQRIPQNRTLIGTCVVDVGTCPIGSCAVNSLIDFFKCPGDGFICPKTETRREDCGKYGIRTYEFVTGCGCCKDSGVEVVTAVIDSDTSMPLKDIMVNAGKKLKGKTDAKGIVIYNIKPKTKTTIIEAVDNLSSYMDALHVLQVPEGFKGPLTAKIAMIKKSRPAMVTPAMGEIALSKDNATMNTANAFVAIQHNSFMDISGTKYEGEVRASTVFIDPSTDSAETIPGRFLTRVGNAEENLISDGIFAFEFTTGTGNNTQIASGQIKVRVREGMRLWNLNKATGMWDAARIIPRKKKRQTIGMEEFVIDVANRQWINIDRIPSSPRCYFKARVFSEDTGTEIYSSQTTYFKPEIIGLTGLNQIFRLYADATRRPGDTCFEVRCPEDDNLIEAKAGYINMTSLEMILVGGINVPYSKVLKPFDISLYDGTRASMDAVNYTVAPNGLDVFAYFAANENGPFYTDKTTCEQSSTNNPSFNFYKPHPPVHDVQPSPGELCTANVIFYDNWNFYNYTDGLKMLPRLSAVSVWHSSDAEHVYTDTSVIQKYDKNVPQRTCVKYRCSLPSEPTIVYLDIDVPNTTDSYQYTNVTDGTIIKKTFSVPAFYCKGGCVGPLCNRRDSSIHRSNSYGSFKAEVKDNKVMDFAACEKGYDDMNTFEYNFYCVSRDGYPHSDVFLPPDL